MENIIKLNIKVDQHLQIKERNLGRYAKKENPNQFIIDKENEELILYTNVFNTLQRIINTPRLRTLLEIDEKMKFVEKRDKQINGHYITVKHVENPNFGFIYIDPPTDDE